MAGYRSPDGHIPAGSSRRILMTSGTVGLVWLISTAAAPSGGKIPAAETLSEPVYHVSADHTQGPSPAGRLPNATSPAGPLPAGPLPGGTDPPLLLAPADGSGPGRGLIEAEQLEAGPRVSEQLEADGAVETPPLQEDVLGWYEYPLRWVSQGWNNHAEFGLNGSDGNAKTLAIQTGIELKRKTDLYTFAIDSDYRQASNRNETTENNGRFNVDYDRMVGESSWSMFSKLGLEWDQFKSFDLRLNLNSGVGYHWLRDDQTTLVTRFGAGSSREFGAPNERWRPEAVFGIDLEHQLTARQILKAKVDYFPVWSDFSEFRLVSDLAWEILLDDAENLSLKLAVTDRYDSTPEGAVPNDVYYSMLLLYKF